MREFLTRHRRGLIVMATLLLLYTLAGFFLAPWLVERQAVKIVAEQFDSELRLGRVAMNPFVLSLTVEGLELDDPAEEPLARVDRIYLNFQTSSAFRRAWTFDEFSIDSPELYLSRDADGRLNLQRLAGARPPAPEPAEPAPTAGLPRLIVYRLGIEDSAVYWSDSALPRPLETRFGPVDVRVQDLNTLPERPGSQEVVIRTANEGTLRWSGTLQLNPLLAAGQAEIDGSHFELLSSYIRHETGLDITEGDADVDFSYKIETRADGEIAATIDDLELAFQGIRVLTFPAAAADGSGRDPRELTTLSRIVVGGGRFQWPERMVSVADVAFGDWTVDLVRGSDGVFDVVRNLPSAPPTEDADGDPTDGQAAAGPATGSTDGSSAWRLALERFRIDDLAVRLRDESVTPVAETSVADVTLEVRDITNEAGATFPTTLSLAAGEGGTVRAEGSFGVMPRPVAAFALTMEDVALMALQPYVQPLANVSFDSGDLDMQIDIGTSAEDPLSVAGDLSVNDFRISETESDTTLGSWESVQARQLSFSAAGEKFEVAEVRIEGPYADVLITEEGQVNLGRIAKDRPDGGGDAAASAAAAADDGDSDGDSGDGLPIRVSIGRVVIADGSADFADRSLPLPFEVKISALEGELSTIDTASREPSRVTAEGTVDEYGFLRVGGSITPLDPLRNTDIRAEFENVAMPKFSAYAVPFAGRKIASGSLSLDLGYQFEGRRLVGENKIVLREFELGEEVPHPDATSLPLGLAIALLKDSSGTIDVDLPISGDLDDPQFSIGGVIGNAMGNLIVKIATSPFALLGNLLGVESSQLEQVVFLPGRTDLTPPQVQTAAKLAEALTVRPQLVLLLPPVHAPEADGRALREARLDATIEERVGAVAADAGYDERVRDTLEALYRELASGEDPDQALATLREEATVVEEAVDDGEPRFDALAYSRMLRERLIPLQTLEDDALDALAKGRAEGLRETIIGAGGDIGGRVIVAEPATVEPTDNERIPMRVKLTAGAPAGT